MQINQTPRTVNSKPVHEIKCAEIVLGEIQFDGQQWRYLNIEFTSFTAEQMMQVALRLEELNLGS